MSEHSKTPWILDIRSGCLAIYNGPPRVCLNSIPRAFIHYKHGVPTGEYGLCELDPQEIADAEFIALAVNSHDQLVEALRKLTDDTSGWRHRIDPPTTTVIYGECGYCGSDDDGRNVGDITHATGCPIAVAGALLASLEPPTEGAPQ